MNTKGIKFLAVLAVMVMAFAAIAIVAPAADNSEGMGSSTTSTVIPTPIQYQEQKVSGIAVDNVAYQANQKIIINEGETWEIGDDTHQICVSIAGELEIPEGSTVLIKAGSTLLITGDMIVNGTIQAEEKQGLMTTIVNEKKETEVVEYKVSSTDYNKNKFYFVDGYDKDKMPKYNSGEGSKQLEMPGFLIIASVEGDGVAYFNNSVSFEGAIVLLDGEALITEGSTLTMGSESYLLMFGEDTAFVVDEDSTLVVNGYLEASFERTIKNNSTGNDFTYTAGIDNFGIVVLDSDKPLVGQVVINQVGDGAVVDVESLVVPYIDLSASSAFPWLVVADKGLVFYEKVDSQKKEITSWFVDNVNSNEFTFGFDTAIVENNQVTISGITITEKVTSKAAADAPTDVEDKKGYISDAKKVYKNTMIISGDVSADTQYIGEASGEPSIATLNMDITANREVAVIADTELILNINTELTVNGIFSIAGAVDVTSKTDSAIAKLTTTGSVYLDGAGTIEYYPGTSAQYVSSGKLFNAAEIVLEKNKVNMILTVDAALATDMSAFDVKTITLKGESKITADAILASGIEFNVNGQKLTINSGKKLMIEDGAKLKGASGEIVVKGTMYAENASNVTFTNIDSDVKSQETNEKGAVVKNGWVQWDNLVSALASAVPGSTITVTKDNLTIDTSITIPEGVYLDIPSSNITVKDGTVSAPTTITVNGTLEIATDMEGATWGTKAKVVVTGFFITNETTVAGVYGAAGAYFVNEYGNVVITTLANAALLTDEAIAIYGTVSETSAVVIGDDQALTIYGALTVSDLTIYNVTVATDGEATLSGKVTSELGVIQLSKYDGNVVADDKKMTIDKIVGTITIASGTVTSSGEMTAAEKSVFNVNNGATFVVASKVTLDNDATTDKDNTKMAYIAGIVEVAASGELTINNKDATFTGSIVVKKNGTLNLATSVDENNATKRFNVLGSIVAEDGSTFNVTKSIAVGTQPTSVGATASIAGKVNLAEGQYIIVFPGADVSKMVINGEDAKSTKFILNGKEIATVYVNSNVKVEEILGVYNDETKKVEKTGAIDFSKIEGINTTGLYDPATWGFETGQEKIGAISQASATAPAAQITIRTSHVIGASLFIDGVRVQSEYYTLAVGTHTLSGSVDPGYEGSIVFTYKGVTVQGGQITIAIGDDDAVLALGGDIHAVEPEVPEDKSGEITITEILLIVLVILIAVMCVVLILRLNRS